MSERLRYTTADMAEDGVQRVVMPADELKRNAALYRVKLHCKLGRDALEGKGAENLPCSQQEYAVFCLLHAVEDLALAIGQLLVCPPLGQQTSRQTDRATKVASESGRPGGKLRTKGK
jgi:hypothetical protein